jgi:hypothetical protein
MRKGLFAFVLAGLLAAPALADSANDGGQVWFDTATGSTMPTAEPRAAPVYDNIEAPATAKGGFSSTDLLAVWGDRLNMTSGCWLSSFKHTVYNSSTSAGPLTNPMIEIDFYDQLGSTYYGGFYGTLSGSLAVGYYWTVTWTGLDALNLVLPQNILVTQTILSFSGAATKLGMVTKGPINVGTSPDNFYVDATDWGPPGYYRTATVGNNDVGYEVIPEPATLALLGLGALALIRRR